MKNKMKKTLAFLASMTMVATVSSVLPYSNPTAIVADAAKATTGQKNEVIGKLKAESLEKYDWSNFDSEDLGDLLKEATKAVTESEKSLSEAQAELKNATKDYDTFLVYTENRIKEIGSNDAKSDDGITMTFKYLYEGETKKPDGVTLDMGEGFPGLDKIKSSLAAKNFELENAEESKKAGIQKEIDDLTAQKVSVENKIKELETELAELETKRNKTAYDEIISAAVEADKKYTEDGTYIDDDGQVINKYSGTVYATIKTSDVTVKVNDETSPLTADFEVKNTADTSKTVATVSKDNGAVKCEDGYESSETDGTYTIKTKSVPVTVVVVVVAEDGSVTSVTNGSSEVDTEDDQTYNITVDGKVVATVSASGEVTEKTGYKVVEDTTATGNGKTYNVITESVEAATVKVTKEGGSTTVTAGTNYTYTDADKTIKDKDGNNVATLTDEYKLSGTLLSRKEVAEKHYESAEKSRSDADKALTTAKANVDYITSAKTNKENLEAAEAEAKKTGVQGIALSVDKKTAQMILNIYVSEASDKDNLVTIDGATKAGTTNDKGEFTPDPVVKINSVDCVTYTVNVTPKTYDKEIAITNDGMPLYVSAATYMTAAESYFTGTTKDLVVAMNEYCKAAKAYLDANPSESKYAALAAGDVADDTTYAGSSIIITDTKFVTIRNYFAKGDTFVSQTLGNYTLGSISSKVVRGTKTVANYIAKLEGDAKKVGDALVKYDTAVYNYTK